VAGNRDAQSRNEMKRNEKSYMMILINSLESVGMEGTRGYGWPWIVKEWWKRNKLYFLFGNRLWCM
jgi:hypothetical protein